MPYPALSLRRILGDLPIPRKLALIIGLFSTVIVLLLALIYFGMDLLSGARALVGGESLWSKGQKHAVFHLTRYAFSKQEVDYQKYLADLNVPLGDRQARRELAKLHYDYQTAADGFLKGGNDPADIWTMIFLLRQFHAFPYVRDAIVAWSQGDADLEKLQAVADEVRKEIVTGHPQSVHLQKLLQDIHDINNDLTPLEDRFSYVLGEGNRWLKNLLFYIMLGTTLVFLSLAMLTAFWISRHLCGEIDNLRENAKRIASGDYRVALHVDSKDEIGDLAKTFQEMADKRQEAERLKDEFFANVSHELRTPLTLILSPLESLLAGDRGTLPPEALPLAKTMHNNSIRLLQLVNGLLDFSKISAGKLTANREPVRIGDLTDTIFKDFQPMIQQKGIRAPLEKEPNDAVIEIDRYFYERILFNLLANAVKFTSSDGVVDVKMTWSRDQLTLTVRDTGIGIPAHEQPHIFQRFRQVEGSATRRFEGTGLGLALVKELTALLGGTVTVDSTEGKGSTFTVHVSAPAAKSSPAGALSDPSMQRLKAQQYETSAPKPKVGHETLPKVLVAEDNTEMAAYIESLLEPICQTRIARDGNDAFSQVKAWSPDLVLTDVMMPGRDGLSLCRDLKADVGTSDIPVIMVTALTHRDALLEGWKAGANEYLFKPFHPKELVTRVQSMLDAVQSQKRSREKIFLLNDDLQRQAKDLVISNQELEAFSYSVSHDLRTPLRAIEGFTHELLERAVAASDRRNQEDLERVRAAAQQMDQLIESLLKLSHLSRTNLERQTVDLSATANGIIQKMKEAQPQRPVNVVVANGLTAKGDPNLLQIALENLLQNAWKFTGKQPHPTIEVGVSNGGSEKAFFVRDNGAGFNMAYAKSLFKPFQRLHKPTEFTGTGLGLALVGRIVGRHGGRVWAEAQENKGATFYFTLS